ncbi:LysE family translocator [Maridesulfovibrio sp.]|uniref:LysE family translocator n=1 Tax=Maridesulfovibrio sp. TaxID=2795000 RepID=UPI002A188886|nr:LysE family translocator [Maridesulfovibrio sp.]
MNDIPPQSKYFGCGFFTRGTLMDVKFWSVYVLTVFLASIVPGPSMILALTHGIRFGTRRALATASGNCAASFLQALVSMAGLGALLAASEPAFMAVKYAGAAYLVWIGINVFRAGDFNVDSAGISSDREVSSGRLFLQGFWVAAGNPKAIIFFSALFPQFIGSGQASVGHFAAMLILLCIIAFACMMIYACGGQRLRDVFKESFLVRSVNKMLGTAFVGLGVGLACSRR